LLIEYVLLSTDGGKVTMVGVVLSTRLSVIYNHPTSKLLDRSQWNGKFSPIIFDVDAMIVEFGNTVKTWLITRAIAIAAILHWNRLPSSGFTTAVT